MWLLKVWYYLMELIWVPLDGICVDFYMWLEENIVDPILDMVEEPEWQPAVFEFGLSSPILAITTFLPALADRKSVV